MKPWILVAVVAFFASCGKDERPVDARLSAYCKGCSVEYYDGHGALHRDTMHGEITYTYVDGNPIPDTVAGWAAWNVVLKNGDSPRITACPLPGSTGPFTVRASGGVTREATADVGCVSLHQ